VQKGARASWEGVFNLRRYLPVYLPIHEAVLFERFQTLDQHLFRYAKNGPAQCAESNRFVLTQMKQHLGFPFATDDHHGQLKIAPEFHVPSFFYIALIGRTISITQVGKSGMVA
jgi:hypothetical protein